MHWRWFDYFKLSILRYKFSSNGHDGKLQFQFSLSILLPLMPPSHPYPSRRSWLSCSSAERTQPCAKEDSFWCLLMRCWCRWCQRISWCRCTACTMVTRNPGTLPPCFIRLLRFWRQSGERWQYLYFHLFKTAQHSTQTRQLLCFGANRNGFSLIHDY